MSQALTVTQLAILEALATFRLLTAEQLHAAGASQHVRHVRAVLNQLCPKLKGSLPSPPARRANLPIDYLHFGNVTGRGSRADVWHLTRAGGKLLAEVRGDPEPLRVPARIEPYPNEYQHRCHTVDCHIALRRWAQQDGFAVDHVHTYFGRGDERYRTRVEYQRERKKAVIVPDAIAHLTSGKGIKRLYALEVYEGRKTARAVEQLVVYLDVIEQEAIERQFDFKYAVQVLAVFDTDAGERLTRERLAAHPGFANFAELFFFKTVPQVQSDFRRGWRRVGARESVPLF